jgi:Mn2+/Fe2+ NRAMP family transporter
MPWNVSLWILYIEQLTQFAVIVLICYFFITAASKLVGKDRVKRWERGLFILILASYGLFIAEVIIIVSEGEKDYLCHTNEFWI